MPDSAVLAVKQKSKAAPADRLLLMTIADGMGTGGDESTGYGDFAYLARSCGLSPEAAYEAAVRLIELGELDVNWEGDGLMPGSKFKILLMGPYIRPPQAPRTGHPPISPRLRLKIYKRDGYECVIPGCMSKDLTIDYKIPFSRGGTADEDNLQTMCRSHNSSKGARI